MTKLPEDFKNYFWGENKLFFPEEEFVIKLSYPRVFVRYRIGEAYFSDFEEFWTSIAEIQYLDGEQPSEKEQQKILIDIWNYIVLEERKLEEDLAGYEEDEFYDDES